MMPFYIIAHRVNAISDVASVVEKGANAIECDIRTKDGLLWVSHAPDTDWIPLEEHLDTIAEVALTNESLALVIFDSKVEDPAYSLELLSTVRNRLTSLVDLNLIISVGDYDNRVFLQPIIDDGLREREGLAIDAHNDPAEVVNFFEANGVSNYAYGNGITVVAPGPNVPNSILNAISEKSLQQNIKMVYVWTIRKKRAFRNYLRMGLDGIMVNPNRINELIDVLNEDEFRDEFRLAIREDNPFLVEILPNYVLHIQTADKKHAGTNAKLSFNLHGTRGLLTKVISSSPYGLFERNDMNRITLSGEDIGDIESLTVSRNSSGVAPGWYLQDVTLESTTTELSEIKRFVFDSWIPRSGLERKCGVIEYEIQVRTSGKLRAGTDANILFQIIGESEDGTLTTIDFRISGDGDIFERGKLNQRTFSERDIGVIKSLVVSHDGSGTMPGWKLNWIRISTETQDVRFEVNQWVETGSSVTIST